jgi:hypothetical protein
MVVNKLQNGVLNSRKTQSASRLNCQNIFLKYGDFYSETNDEHQARSYQNSLRYNVIN